MKHRRIVGTFGVILALTFPLFTTTTANAAPSAAVVNAVDRIAQGGWTYADLALVRQHPDIAATTPDPTKPLEVVSSSWAGRAAAHPSYDPFPTEPPRPGGYPPIYNPAPRTVYCSNWAYLDMIKRSLLGNVIFRWRHYIQWCRNVTSTKQVVSSWEVRKDYMVESQSGVYMRELTAAWQSGLGTPEATSFRQRHIEYCVFKIGCYSNRYLFSYLYAKGNGGYRVGATGGM